MSKKLYKYRKSFSFNGKRYEVYGKTEKELYEKMFLKKQLTTFVRLMVCREAV